MIKNLNLLNEKDLHIINYNNSFWLLIFHHFAGNGEYFNEETAKYCKEENRYSILSNITEQFQIKSKYEFLISYPEQPPPQIWRQINFPLYEEEKSTGAEGFEPIHITETIGDRKIEFRGLQLSQTDACLIDGNIEKDYWNVAIGANSIANQIYPNQIPSFKTPFPKVVNLYIRIPELFFNQKCKNCSLLLISKTFLFHYFLT